MIINMIPMMLKIILVIRPCKIEEVISKITPILGIDDSDDLHAWYVNDEDVSDDAVRDGDDDEGHLSAWHFRNEGINADDDGQW